MLRKNFPVAKNFRRKGALERLEVNIQRYEKDSVKADEEVVKYLKGKLKLARFCLENLKEKIKSYG
jgi:hypothetical protein